jgi:hypothetical protein
MAQIEELERRLEEAETMLQAMFCTVTADLIMFQAAVTALREEGVLTEKMVDRMAIDAQIRLQQFDNPTLSPPVVSEIAAQLDGLAERLREAAPSAPLVDRATSGNERTGAADRPAE